MHFEGSALLPYLAVVRVQVLIHCTSSVLGVFIAISFIDLYTYFSFWRCAPVALIIYEKQNGLSEPLESTATGIAQK